MMVMRKRWRTREYVTVLVCVCVCVNDYGPYHLTTTNQFVFLETDD